MTKEFGTVAPLPSYGLKVIDMSEEHITLGPDKAPLQLPSLTELDQKYAKPAKRPLGVGDKILLIPSHCCTTVNLHDLLYAVRDGKVEVGWEITGRGRFV